ncbi:Na/Pi cotransporter family protein [Emergencia timonensis]|uniref:Na/Pi cotransporter family protein n=1 Tax=Emergencia timonensis TaxID=1776384 RepID=UPI003991077C
MDIFSFISLFGGLALFLYGMSLMSQGLEKLAGGKLEGILKKMTSNPVKSLFLGIGITAVIQSSSAVTVMLVGLVNSGIMQLSGTVGVIMGSNIGTTVTAWILSLVGIESNNVWIKLLKPESFSPILALIGIILMMSSKTSKKKDIGSIMIGFAILMYGMDFMSDSVSPLADMPEFTSMLTAFTNPLLGILTGLILTAVIQSSSASVGILQALTLTGGISYGMAIPIIMGQNIGTCVTALISSIGVNKNAKRVAVIHIAFNLLGTAVCLLLYFVLHFLVDLSFIEQAISPVGVAVVHSIFNITTTVLLLPFSKQLVKLAEGTIKTEPEKEIAFLDERLLKTPSIALQECNHITTDMAYVSKQSMMDAMDLLFSYNEKKAAGVKDLEGEVDIYEDRLGSYLVKLSGYDLSDTDSKQISKLLHTIGDFERISDHAVNVMQAAKEIEEKKAPLSPEGLAEIKVATAAIREIMEIAIKAFDENNLELAYRVEPLEQVVDGIIEGIKLNHINRLQAGKCTIQQGFVLSDILTNYERVSDHCSNIAVAMIELSKSAFDTHEYLDKLKTMDDPEFRKMFTEYKKKYAI